MAGRQIPRRSFAALKIISCCWVYTPRAGNPPILSQHPVQGSASSPTVASIFGKTKYPVASLLTPLQPPQRLLPALATVSASLTPLLLGYSLNFLK